MRSPIFATHPGTPVYLIGVLFRSRKVGRFFLGLCLACGVSVVCGQSALDGFDPNANGPINAIVVQPDGKILIGGNFTILRPNGGPIVTRNRIARLNADGTLDTSFNPNANSTVNSIALQADGKILVGGFFSGAGSIGGATRNFIARLDPITGLADSFDPNASADVTAIAVQADGKIVVGGNFSGANSIGGAARNFIARLDPLTGAVAVTATSPGSYYLAFEVATGGRGVTGVLRADFVEPTDADRVFVVALPHGLNR